ALFAQPEVQTNSCAISMHVGQLSSPMVSEVIMNMHSLTLFALAGSEAYAEGLAAQLETPLSPIEQRHFEDGEHKIRPLVPVEGHDVYVTHALHGDRASSVNDKLCRLLF